MKIEKVNIQDLISPDYNPRDITPEEMEKLKTSIQEFGYISPIIVNKHNNHIIGGNQRYEAMKQLGYTEVEVSYVNITDLNREKALNIRLNKLSGVWDQLKLDNILEELQLNNFDVSLTGFDIKTTSFDNITSDFNNINNNISSSDNIIGNSTYEDNNTNEDYFEIPDEEPEYDETIADNIETITCPRCGYELPKH